MSKSVLPLAITVWVTVWAGLTFLVQPPIPGSVMGLYMAITTISILVFLVADPARFKAALAPIVTLLKEDGLVVPRTLAILALTLGVGWLTYTKVRPQFDPPFEARMGP